jgi:hypothetical protein
MSKECPFDKEKGAEGPEAPSLSLPLTDLTPSLTGVVRAETGHQMSISEDSNTL